MKVLVLAAIVGAALGGRLDNSYLPPSTGSFRAANGGLGGVSSPGLGGAPSSGPQGYSSPGQAKHIPILKFAAENEGEGTYRYNYETANSITAEEQGDARGDGTKAHGSYSYTGPDGQHFSISYTADENGFVPQGSHIPTPPPIPEAILKALQENAEAEARGVFDDGQYHGEGLDEAQYRGEGEGSGRSSSTGAGSAAGAAFGSGGTAYAANGGYRY